MDGEVDTGHCSDFANIVVDRISFSHSPGRVGMSDAGGVVQLHDGVESRQPRCNHLRSTAKTCEKVRFYKPCRDLKITFHPSPIQQYANPTPRSPAVNQ